MLAIRSLDIGGAERQFIELVKNIDKSKFKVMVCTMFKGSLESELSTLSTIDYQCFNKKNRYDLISYYNYTRAILRFKPDLIYSFLSDLNIISFICSKISLSNSKLVWGIRGSITDLNLYGFFAKLIFYFQKLISKAIDLMIYNSYTAQKGYSENGYNAKTSTIIQNGFDTQRFYKNSDLRTSFRNEYGMKETDIAIGITSRLDPVKGYKNFCEAAVNLLDKYHHIIFFAIGYGDEDIQRECEIILGSYNDKRFIWLGKQLMPENIMPAWDIYCSASLPGEGFPNAIAEAMLCGLVPVVTNSGDSGMIINDHSLLCACGDTEDLRIKLEKTILNPALKKSGEEAREKIVTQFSMSTMVNRTQSELEKLLINKFS